MSREIAVAYVRVQKRGNRHYYYLVESRRDGAKVRQKVLQYLGTARPEQQSVNQLIRQIQADRARTRGQ